MSKELLAQIKKSREFTIEFDKNIFTARRPTDVEAVQISAMKMDYSEIATQFVIGWKGVTENDILGNGGSDEIPFSQELWAEWCADSPRFWKRIGTAVMEQYVAHSKKNEEMQKN